MINNQFSLEMKSGIEPIGGHRLTERARKTVCTVPGVPAGFNPLRLQHRDERTIARYVPKTKMAKVIF
ncbi:hypothetical protein ACLH2L_21105 [Klebsiella grimontii]|jgi:hypothetical protein|uniref:hypothetical protein n=1 Tax=Klebsiella grimontii TaxID=2058152 RepID=UPI0003F91E2F|nr:hypothetical protein [Klebsiella grimontii]